MTPTDARTPNSYAVINARVAELAGAQHGVFALAQLEACGLTAGAVKQRARRKTMHRVHRGVYSLAPPKLLRPRGELLAAVLAVGHGAVISMQSAAELHDLMSRHLKEPHLTVISRGARARSGIHVHHSNTLRLDQDTTTIDGIPVTNLARTIFDLAGELNVARLERIVDSALQSEYLDLDHLLEQIARNRHRYANVVALNKILARDTIGSKVSWNEFERSFLALIDELRLPRPGIRQWLDLDDGEPMIEPDFMWRELKLIVETDGWQEHGLRKRFETDRHRDQRVAAAGIQTVRVTWRQLTGERELTGRLLTRTARQRRALFATTTTALAAAPQSQSQRAA